MTVYVLGAGASVHAGYPLVKSMLSNLFGWMKKQQGTAHGYLGKPRERVEFFEQRFPGVENFEDLLTKLDEQMDKLSVCNENGTPGRLELGELGTSRAALSEALRGWFDEIRQQDQAQAYQQFARNIVKRDDCIITFNYDVSLDRELALAGKFAVGDGYGFPIDGLSKQSPIKILKLHGSTNWLTRLFGGIGPGQFGGSAQALRPVIAKNDLAQLGCADATDPEFPQPMGAGPAMIMPTHPKKYDGFLDGLWLQADAALQAANRIVICGYGMIEVDERARELLLNAPKKDADVLVGSGERTGEIVRDYQGSGYTRAKPADEVMFEKWVDSCTNVAAS